MPYLNQSSGSFLRYAVTSLRTGFVLALILSALTLSLPGCATPEPRDARLVAEQPECRVGEILQCRIASTGRLSDRRFGDGDPSSQDCKCEPESNVRGLPR